MHACVVCPNGLRVYHGAAAKQGLEQPRWQHWLDTAVWGQPASQQVVVPSGGGSRGTSNSSGTVCGGTTGGDPWGESEEYLQVLLAGPGAQLSLAGDRTQLHGANPLGKLQGAQRLAGVLLGRGDLAQGGAGTKSPWQLPVHPGGSPLENLLLLAGEMLLLTCPSQASPIHP